MKNSATIVVRRNEAHAAGQVLDRLVAPLRELHGLEQLGDEAPALLARHAVEPREDDEILLDGELGITRERLRDDADRPAHGVGILDDVRTADGRAAGGGRHDEPRPGALAGSEW